MADRQKKKLSAAQRKRLRGRAHDLKPVVQLGKAGLTEGLLVEINRSLEAHQLIKLKFVQHKDSWQALASEIELRSDSEFVGGIGNCAILYRSKPPEHLTKGRSAFVKCSGNKKSRASTRENPAFLFS